MSNRLDFFLVEKGYAQSRERAKIMIKNGGVIINGKTVLKPSSTVAEADAVTVISKDIEYVGRGALKLERAFELFDISVDSLICADIGASTGGFTEIMLKHGAKKVYAIDVGHGQLAQRLIADERVVNCEGTNVKTLTPAYFTEPLSFMSVDLSFISLKNVMKILSECLVFGGETVVLIKPQFEAGPKALNSKGVVKDRNDHATVLNELLAHFRSCGLTAVNLTYSGITGGDGNIEYLAHLKKADCGVEIKFNVKDIIDAAFAALKR